MNITAGWVLSFPTQFLCKWVTYNLSLKYVTFFPLSKQQYSLVKILKHRKSERKNGHIPIIILLGTIFVVLLVFSSY